MTFLLGACALLLGSAQAEAVDIKWKFEEGKQLRYEVTQSRRMSIQGSENAQVTTTTYLWTIKDVTEGGDAVIRIKYDALRVKVTGFQEYEYDSRKEKGVPAHPALEIQAKLVGQFFTITMTPAGEIKAAAGFDKILDKLLEDQPEEQQELARARMEQMYSADVIKSMFQQMMPPLPGKKVAVGDTWNRDFEVKLAMAGSLKFAGAAKLSEVKEGNARIEQEMKVSLKQDAGPGGRVQINDAKGDLAATFSLERGAFLDTRTELKMKVTAQGQEIPVNFVSEMKLVEKRREF